MKVNIGLVMTTLAVLLATPSRAEAYLDPGTGSMVFQIAIGSALAAIATGKIYWRRIQSMLQGRKDQDASQPNSQR